MFTLMKSKFLIILIFFLLLSISQLFLIKQFRILLPSIVGINCMRHNICVENLEDIQQAEVLYEEALDFVNKNVAVINQPPTVIFCATQSCFESFGFGYQKAVTFGQLGIVVGPNGWKDFFIRHEMIHHLQNERWGSLRCRFFLPKWLVEGMAYSLSKDPRDDLAEPMRSQRIQFEGWLKNIDKEQLWNQY